jgi:3-oxoacyl-[acyl-carrier protein] reductase
MKPVALVTGGTRGIGLGIAQALAAEGWDLALCGQRSASDVADVVRSLGESGGSVAYWRADVGSPADRAAFLDQVMTRFGDLHALVNNAGGAPRVRADLLEAGEASFEELVRTNLQGPYFLTQAVARLMIDRRQEEAGRAVTTTGASTPQADGFSVTTTDVAMRHRAIVFITSVSADLASPNRGEYCVSKAGLAMAVKLFAARLAADQVPVYEVRPGIIATDMTAGVREVYDRRIAEGLVPEQRWGTPADVGRVVAALLRGDLPYATGAVIPVDGGLTVPRL